MAKKPFSFDDNWASVIYRVTRGNKDYIGASVRRRYDDEDIEKYGPNSYVGLETTPVYDKITDTDPDSVTAGKRINKPDSEPTRTRTSFTIEFNDKSVKDFKKLVGVTNMGETRFVYIFREHSYEAPSIDDFWKKKMKDVYDEVVKNRVTVNLKQGTNVAEENST